MCGRLDISMIPRLELRDISKYYPGVVANNGISLSVKPNVIHAVLGENGAGKSTLMKIIYGAVQADRGQIFCDGNEVLTHNPAWSRSLGIEMVYQHFALFESISVVENIALSLEGKFDLVQLAKDVATVSEKYGLRLSPHRIVHNLSVGERQCVEIVRCLMRKPKLLILDEPTSVLTPQAVEHLFETLRRLAASGCSILYISHKLGEVQALCDSATVLRNGMVVGSVNPKESSAVEIARMMIGTSVPEMHIAPSIMSKTPFIDVSSLTAKASDVHGTDLKDVAFSVHGGEIVGIAGVAGNGQRELISLLSGERTNSDRGSIKICGRSATNLNARQRRELGMAFIPEERLGRGAVPPQNMIDNSALTGHRLGMVSNGLLNRRMARAFAEQVIKKFGVKCNGPVATAQSLSGGNLQKFIVGREIGLNPKVFLVSQPTWGVDIGAAMYIRQTLVDLSRNGAAVLVLSEELDELFEICDRLHVICRGKMSDPLARGEVSVEDVGLLMTGISGNGSPLSATAN